MTSDIEPNYDEDESSAESEMEKLMASPHWVNTKLLDLIKPVEIEPYQEELATTLIDAAYQNALTTSSPVGYGLAAAFDILAAAEFYGHVKHDGWLYCPQDSPLTLYPFTNACPRCALVGKPEDQFHFFKSNKASSGNIGDTTTTLLCAMLKLLFQRNKRNLEVFRGKEPVDLVVKDGKNLLLAEVKAAPLVTLPLAMQAPELRGSGDEAGIPLGHTSLPNQQAFSASIYAFLPVVDKNGWSYELIDLGHRSEKLVSRKNKKPKDVWAYESFNRAFQNDKDLFGRYLAFWNQVLEAYTNKSGKTAKGMQRNSVFWLANSCGRPTPTPSGWPKRSKGGGYESISDGKTSVGMDRTDDIKKGIYQVLKIGATSKPNNTKYDIKTALVSNIHAVLHYEVYLQSLDNLVWTLDPSKKAKTAVDLADETRLYNLLDGIITLTSAVYRDEWIETNFSF